MAYWMVACSVYLYVAILGANVRICISVVVLVVVTIVGRGGDGDRREPGQDDPDVTVDAARYLPGVYAAVEMTWLVK
jgi:hypothetical protein